MGHEATEALSEMLIAGIFDDNIGIDASTVMKVRVKVDAFCTHLWEIWVVYHCYITKVGIALEILTNIGMVAQL